MKKLLTICVMLIAMAVMTNCKNGTDNNTDTTIAADTTTDCIPLFDSLVYDENGIAEITDLTIIIKDYRKYDFPEDAPVYTWKKNGTALAFDHCGKEYYIPLDAYLVWFDSIELPDTAIVSIIVWRDYKEHGHPFAVIQERIKLYHGGLGIE